MGSRGVRMARAYLQTQGLARTASHFKLLASNFELVYRFTVAIRPSDHAGRVRLGLVNAR